MKRQRGLAGAGCRIDHLRRREVPVQRAGKAIVIGKKQTQERGAAVAGNNVEHGTQV